MIVVNGMEGEPASAKDAYLLSFAPHLVLDGAALAAAAVGADAVHVAVRRDRVGAVPRSAAPWPSADRPGSMPSSRASTRAAALRRRRGERAGALAQRRPDPPGDGSSRPFERGVEGRPTLVLNAETAAHLALIARYGDAWFRTVGRPDATGTALLTVSGSVVSAGVTEIALGSSLEAVVAASRPSAQPEMVLTGGYFGGWIPWESCRPLAVAPADLRAAGGGLGAGILVVAPAGACVLAETARIVAYLANESARQCGPCLHGVAAVARDLALLCTVDADAHVTARLRSRIGVIDGRGACALPDGVRRLVASVLRGFPDHVGMHERFGPCRGAAGVALPSPLPRCRRPTGGEALPDQVDRSPAMATDCASTRPRADRPGRVGLPRRRPGPGGRHRGRPRAARRLGVPQARAAPGAGARVTSATGVEGNRCSTAALGAVLLVLLAVEGGTIPLLSSSRLCTSSSVSS